jgi:hypothetical protein
MDSVKALVKYQRKKGHIVPEEDEIIAHFWGALHKGLTNLEQTNFLFATLRDICSTSQTSKKV